MSFERKICVGLVLKPVGIKGQVKIQAYTSSPEALINFKKFFLSNNTAITLKNPKVNEKGFVVSFIEGFVDRTSVEQFHLQKLYVQRKDMEDLSEDEYYLEDLANLEVINQNNETIGKVLAALDYGAGAFLEIRLDGAKIATLPFNKHSILDVDLENGVIKIDQTFLLR